MATGRDHLIVELARQRQVGQPVAMHVAHLLPPVAVFGAAEPVRKSLDSRPGHDGLPDPLARAHHAETILPPADPINKPTVGLL
jgi:hypothetical protein